MPDEKPTFESLLKTFRDILKNTTPYIQEVSQTAKFNIIQQTIGYAHSLGLTQAFSREVYREAGFTFGDAAFNNLFSATIETPYLIGRVRYTSRENMLTENAFDIGIYKMDTRYRYVGEYIEYDFDTNSISKKRFSIASDNLMTRAEVEKMIEDEISAFYGKELTQTSDVNLRFAYVNPKYVE